MRTTAGAIFWKYKSDCIIPPAWPLTKLTSPLPVRKLALGLQVLSVLRTLLGTWGSLCAVYSAFTDSLLCV